MGYIYPKLLCLKNIFAFEHDIAKSEKSWFEGVDSTRFKISHPKFAFDSVSWIIWSWYELQSFQQQVFSTRKEIIKLHIKNVLMYIIIFSSLYGKNRWIFLHYDLDGYVKYFIALYVFNYRISFFIYKSVT